MSGKGNLQKGVRKGKAIDRVTAFKEVCCRILKVYTSEV